MVGQTLLESVAGVCIERPDLLFSNDQHDGATSFPSTNSLHPGYGRARTGPTSSGNAGGRQIGPDTNAHEIVYVAFFFRGTIRQHGKRVRFANRASAMARDPEEGRPGRSIRLRPGSR